MAILVICLLLGCRKVERAAKRLVSEFQPEPQALRIDHLLDPQDQALFKKYFEPHWNVIGPREKRNLVVQADRILLDDDTILLAGNKVTFIRWYSDKKANQIVFSLSYDGRVYNLKTSKYWDLFHSKVSKIQYESMLAEASKFLERVSISRQDRPEHCREMQIINDLDERYQSIYRAASLLKSDYRELLRVKLFICQNDGLDIKDLSAALLHSDLAPKPSRRVFVQKPTGVRLYKLPRGMAICSTPTNSAVSVLPIDLDSRKAPLVFKKYVRCMGLQKYALVSYQGDFDALVAVNDFDEILAKPAKEIAYDQLINYILRASPIRCREALDALRYFDRYSYAHWLKDKAQRPSELLARLSERISNCSEQSARIGPQRNFQHPIGDQSFLRKGFFDACGVPTPTHHVQNLADPIVRNCYNGMMFLLPIWCEINARDRANTGVLWTEATPDQCQLMRGWRSASGQLMPYKVHMMTANEMLRTADISILSKYSYRRYRVLSTKYSDSLLEVALNEARKSLVNAVQIEGSVSYAKLAAHLLTYLNPKLALAADDPESIMIGKALREFNKLILEHRSGSPIMISRGDDITNQTSPRETIVPTSLSGLGLADSPIEVEYEYSAYIY